MSKLFLIFKNELITTINRRSFIVTLFLIPAASGIIMVAISILGKNTSQFISQIFSSTPQKVMEGYVDESGLIKSLPPDGNTVQLISFKSEAQARSALARGEITGFYVIAKDYLTSGTVIYIRNDFNPLAGVNQTGAIQNVIRYNLLNGNALLANQLENPMQLEQVNLAPQTPQREQGNPLTFILPYVVAMIFYIVILTAASLMLNSVTSEKQNRVIEILMVSITPTQMLTGKILALALVGLLQTIVWTGAGYALLLLSGQRLNLSAAFYLPPSILIWGAVFFLLGYALYAGFMAGVGALVPNLREASQATTMMVIPLVVPLIFLSSLSNSPNGAIAILLSLFPLTSPVAMMTRLASGSVPLWQIITSALILLISALLIIRSVAGLFRAQTLLTGQTFNLRTFIKALSAKNS